MESRQISYGKNGPVAFQHHSFSTLEFADLRKRLATSIEAAGLWVLQEVDAHALLQRDAYVIGGAVQILAVHPRFMARLLAADPAALLAAPLKFALLALPDGTVAKVEIHFDAMEAISKIARTEYGLSGAVQHGASTVAPVTT